MIVTNSDVWLEWAYCEAGSRRFDNWCPDDAINALRQRIRTGEAKFNTLSSEDKATLQSWIRCTRAPYIGVYLDGTDCFSLEEWPASKLKEIMCMPRMGNTTFGEYILKSPPKPDDIQDSRVAAQSMSWDPKTANPIIVGLSGAEQVLVDGYTRGILFIRDSPLDSFIKAYVPCQKS